MKVRLEEMTYNNGCDAMADMSPKSCLEEGAMISEPRYYGFGDSYYGFDGHYYGYWQAMEVF